MGEIQLESDANLLDEGKTCEISPDVTNFAEFCMNSENQHTCIELGKLRESCIAEAFTYDDCNLNDILNNSTYILSAGSKNWNSDLDFSIFSNKESLDIILKCIKRLFYPEPSKYRAFEKLFDNNYYIEPLLYPISELPSLEELGFTNIYLIRGNSEYFFALLPYSVDFYKFELSELRKKQDGVSQRNEENEYENIINQVKHSKSMFLNIENAIKNKDQKNIYLSNACDEYLKARSYKSESYVTQSSFMIVVLSMQLNIELDIHPNCYIICSYENLLDFKNHMGLKYEGQISNAYVELLKFSKYFVRIFDSFSKSRDWSEDIVQLINSVLVSSRKVVSHRGNEINEDIKGLIHSCLEVMCNFINSFVFKTFTKDRLINIENIEDITINTIFDILLEGIVYICDIIEQQSTTPSSNLGTFVGGYSYQKKRLNDKRSKKKRLNDKRSKKKRLKNKQSKKKRLKNKQSKKKRLKNKQSKKRRSKKKTKYLR